MDQVHAIAVLDNTHFAIAGEFGNMTSREAHESGTAAESVALLANDDDLLWLTRLPERSRALSLAVTSQQDILAAIEFSGEVRLGTKRLGRRGTDFDDVALVRLRGRDGQVSRARGFQGKLQKSWPRFVMDDSGNVAVLMDTLNFDDDPTGPIPEFGKRIVFSGDPSRTSMVLAKLTPQGEVTWARGFGCKGIKQAGGLAVAQSESIVVVGDYLGSEWRCDLGGGPLVSEQPDGGAFVAAYDSEGRYIWSLVIEAGEYLENPRVDVSPEGHVVVVTEVRGGHEDAGPRELFVLSLDASDGKERWHDFVVAGCPPPGTPPPEHKDEGGAFWLARALGPYCGSIIPRGIAALSGDRVVVAGEILNPYPGSTELEGKMRAYGLIVDRSGAVTPLLAEGKEVRGTAVARVPSGEVVVAGAFKDRVTFGDQTLESLGKDDVFVVEVDPSPKQ